MSRKSTVQITVFLQQNTTASLLELYFNDSMQTVYARGGTGGGGGSQQREVADGADVVFTDTVFLLRHLLTDDRRLATGNNMPTYFDPSCTE